MKRNLLVITCSLLVALNLRADVIYNEKFNYSDGMITNVAVGIWSKHSGNASSSDAFVINKQLQVGMSRQDDVNRPFSTGGGVYTGTVTNIFASFTVNCTNLPTASNYFAHFITGTSTFHGRVWNAPGSLPGTWKLGVTTASSVIGLAKFFPVDLATNTDYQVVVNYDETQGANSIAKIWVNPTSAGDLTTVAGDTTTGTIMTGFGFREPGGFNGANNFNITNLVPATTFEEAQTNVWSTNAIAPIVVYSPKAGTNFVGDSFTLIAVAAGQGLSALTYQWTKNGNNISNPDGNTNVLTIPSAIITDTGNYRLIATTPYGLSATSAVAFRWVTNAPVPPTISSVTGTTNVYYHQTASVHVAASGPSPLSYAWFYNNGPLGPNVSGDGTDTITITDVITNNGTIGTYRCDVSNPYGTTPSANAYVSASPIPTATIGFLRTLVDPVTFLATNSTAVWQTTGTVTTLTNLTTGNTSSYYLQDSTAGINIFATLASSFRPTQGDVVTFVGILTTFNGNLELLADTANNPAASYVVLSNNIATLPTPKIIPFTITNNVAATEAVEGSIVMLTNVFFGTNEGRVILTNANTSVFVTNAGGQAFTIVFSQMDQDVAGQTLPAFAHTVIGPLVQNSATYNVTVTRFTDIVTNALAATIAYSPGTSSLTWESAPVSYPYSIWTASDVAGPYTVLTNKLRFLDFSGSFTDPNAGGSAKFYRLSTP